MNKKERLFRAIKLQNVDRIPTTYRGNDYISKELMKYFGIKSSDKLEINHKELVNKLACDFWSTGSKMNKFSVFAPEYLGPEPKDPYIKDSNLFYTLGINSTLGEFKEYNTNYPNIGVDPPLYDVETASELKKGFLTKKLDLFNFKSYRNRYDNNKLKYEIIYDDIDYVISIGLLNYPFMICSYLRGMDKFLMDLMINKELAEFIVGEVSEFCIEFNKRELESFGNKAEYYGSWDDVANQNSLMFQPELFKKYFLPIYKKLIENVQRYELMYGWHCCGNVNEILPSMIEAGIDVFDVVQTSARDMGIDKIYKICVDKICLHGAIDIQTVLASGTPKEVENHVKKIINFWNKKGGIIIAPSHETVPGTPLENIIAIYQAVNTAQS